MKQAAFKAIVAVSLVVLPASAGAGTIVYEPTRPDLYDLPHQYYYTWGISVSEDISASTITGATLRFEDIHNWNDDPNQLYVHLLDAAPLGVEAYWDNQLGGDSFDSQGIKLVEYFDLGTTPQDLAYDLTPDEVVQLIEYVQNGANFGLGIDPDCHYYNNGVSLSLSYETPVPSAEVPEPLTVLAMTAGLGGLGCYVRKRTRHPAA